MTIPEVTDVKGVGDGVEVGLKEERLRWEWGNNTLVVWYEKPTWVREREEAERVARKGLHSTAVSKGAEHDTPADCKQQ